jgi:hypothetical protein
VFTELGRSTDMLREESGLIELPLQQAQRV